MTTEDELARLRRLNDQLITLLESHGIEWRYELEHNAKPQPLQSTTSSVQTSTPPAAPAATASVTDAATLTTSQKIALFRSLFRGRADVYPVRWENNAGKSGYSPACHNEWKRGVCGKPSIKCSQCHNQAWKSVTDEVIYDHLAGEHVIGVYPMIGDNQCHFLAVDFDEGNWQADANAFRQSCEELGVACAIEISRSGNGAHAWVFFSEPVSAKQARNLGAAIISYTCAGSGPHHRQLKLSSYDRMFPNQDTLTKASGLGSGLGNLIALPLQKHPRAKGHSVFVDNDFNPYPDQWTYLASIKPLSVPTRTTEHVSDVINISERGTDHVSKVMATTLAAHIDNLIEQAVGSNNALDVGHLTLEAFDPDAPWQRQTGLGTTGSRLNTFDPTKTITLTLSNLIYLPKAELSPQLINRLIRIAAFQNPEYYKAQALRLPVWNKPRIIACAENFPNHIGLPRGCLDAVSDLLAEHNIQGNIEDQRQHGRLLVATNQGRILTKTARTNATRKSLAMTGHQTDTTPSLEFHGKLRPEQTKAVNAMLAHDRGVLCAPTAFGKTVTAAALIAKRGVNTLVLVHRTELLEQWKERLCGFLGLGDAEIGIIGGGKKTTARPGKKATTKVSGLDTGSAAVGDAVRATAVPVTNPADIAHDANVQGKPLIQPSVLPCAQPATESNQRSEPHFRTDSIGETLIDIAMVQSLVRQGNVNPVVETYGHVIVDECHHVSAVSFEQILKAVKAKYVLGLTATPIRRDGLQPIIMMQCGPIRHRATRSETAPTSLTVHAYEIDTPGSLDTLVAVADTSADTDSAAQIRTSENPYTDIHLPIQTVFQALAQDQARTDLIVRETMIQFNQGRKVLLLTERTDHLLAIESTIQTKLAEAAKANSRGVMPEAQDELRSHEPFVRLHGRMKKSERAHALQHLQSLPPESPRILLATGKLIGEGFDHAPLDTLILAMPISWKGTLQQYVGRLHREHEGKTDILVIDFIDRSHPSLSRMWNKRQAGYKAMGYRVVKAETNEH